MQVENTPWLVVSKPLSKPTARLVCFPHSGGGPSAFAAWGDLLEDDSIEVVAVSAPGRERRAAMAPILDADTLAAEIVEALISSGLVDGPPYAFFGHSLGALIAYECAQLLDAKLLPGRPRPVRLFVSGHGAPDLAVAARTDEGGRDRDLPWGNLHKLGDKELTAAVSKFGIIPMEVLADAAARELVLRTLRADFQVYETYSPKIDRAPLPLVISALGGATDPVVSPAGLSTWQKETSLPFGGPTVFPGGHFYLNDRREEVLQRVVKSGIRESLGALPRSALASAFEVPAKVLGPQTVLHAFLETVQKHDSDEAVVDEHERLTYSELAVYVKRLGAVLQEDYLQGKQDQVVALLTPHNVTYVTAMLGIWVAAGKILVIEAHFNKELCKEICEECAASAAIATPKHAPKFESVNGCRTLVLDGVVGAWGPSLRLPTNAWSLPQATAEDDAILMMTSGTTGRPKTILGSHRFMHLGVLAKNEHSPYTEDDRREAFNVMFVWEVLRPLVCGLASFIIPDDATLDTSIFLSCLEKHSISRVLTTPSLLETMMRINEVNFQNLSTMRTWITCGEILSMTTVLKFRASLPQCKLLNDYSCWEGGDVSYGLVSPQPPYEPSKSFAVGGVLAPGVCIVIVNPESKEIMPRGSPGELYCGGIAISSGYYLKPEATAERFVDPFNEEMRSLWSGKWYKSGDGARLIGEPPLLELSGRIDSTVKIRGFKVGIAVVEQAVASIPGVALCGVVPVYSAPGIVEKLVLFAKPAADVVFDSMVTTLKREGIKRLPRWMMPTTIKPMPEQAFSGGESRKLDRKKLQGIAQEDEDSLRVARQAEEAKAEELQETEAVSGSVRDVVKAVLAKALNLNVRDLDPDENFFDLGGHSMLAAQIALELSGKHGISITILDIYSNSTVGALLDLVDPSSTDALEAPQEIKRPLVRAAPETRPGLAIVGLAGRFPGASDIDAFWANLRTGTVSATFLSKEFLRGKGVPEDSLANKDYVPCAYMMDDVDKFDNIFFGIGRNEAALMDPQHRVFIETAWSAVENAGLNPRSGIQQVVVGVFAASGIDGYLVHHLDGLPLKNSMDPNDIFLAEIGNEKDYIATRVSYLMNFSGPSMNVNSACSSALVAVAQGAAAITAGQCDAVVAGASSITFPNLGYLYMDGLVASVDGYVKPFDKDADGTVFGDSCGAVVVRRRDDVSNNLTWGLARGFAVSNDGGRKAGYAAPSSAGQAQAIRAALEMMGESAWSLSYVECHATGTRVGDGIEMRGLIDAMKQVGGAAAPGRQVALGSVKGNIAHANCAAGVTGLAKLLLMMRAKQLPPTANFKVLNPKIDLGNTPFFINTELTRWNVGDGGVRRAGVSSFGIGGTNAHCVIEEPPDVKVRSGDGPSASFQVFPFAAKSAGALRRSADHVVGGLRRCMEEPIAAGIPSPTLATCAYTMQTGRAEFALRKALVLKTNDASFAAAADAVEKAMPDEEELDDIDEARRKPAVALVFPGQGSQYFGMGRGLYDEIPLYREVVDRCCEILLRPDFLGFDIRSILLASHGGDDEEKEREKQFARPSVLQPCLFVTEYALAQVFLAVGISPIAVAGHSLGEYTASVIGGLLDLEAACSIVAARSKSTETLAEDGAMLSVADWSKEELDIVSRGLYKGLWVAAVNSPVHAVISGETAAVDKLEADLKQAGKKCAKLQVRKAFHSGLVQKAADTLKGLGVPKNGADASIPIASNKTGAWLSAALLRDGSYWTDHMRGTVLWRENAEKLLTEHRPAVVLECGPMNALSTLTKKCIPKGVDAPTFIQAMRHPKAKDTHDCEALLGAISQLWERGCEIDWLALQTKLLGARAAPEVMRLPGYGFERTSLWANPERSVYVDATADPVPALYANLAAGPPASTSTTMANSSSSGAPVKLIRFASRAGPSPSIRAYCLPFASGSARLFAPWSEPVDDAVEVVAIELPGRGGCSDQRMPTNDAEDLRLLEAIGDAIIADARGTPYVLVGFSMGGGLCAQIALQMVAKNAPEPLALYVAGRKPPAMQPGDVHGINMSNEELAEYAFAPPDVANSPEFIEHVVPLLRQDLELDARTERRLSAAHLSGQSFPSGMGLELFCGTNDEIAPFSAAPGWQRFTKMQLGLHYYPGGHEFMQEQRSLIFTAWRRDAVGRLLQRRATELALLSAQGFSQPGQAAVPSLKAGLDVPETESKLPLYAVRWVPAIAPPLSVNGKAESFLVDLSAAIVPMQDAATAMQNGATIVAISPPSEGVLSGQAVHAEVEPCWRFVQLVQHLLNAGLSGHIVVACAAAVSGAMVSGASKAIALEAAELRMQRVFLPPASFRQAPRELAARASIFASKHPGETDLWVQASGVAESVYTQRIESCSEPSSKLECVPQLAPDGHEAKYVLTGATGGLGSALVEWLVGEQKINPDQLILVRRAGSRALSGVLARCRVVEVTNVNSEEALSDGLNAIGGVVGMFHLAGVLDDGIVQGMTEERFQKVAEPKCGMLVALLRTAIKLTWPLRWVLGFSSTSSLFGYAGQSNYCAANAMLDHMATFACASDVSAADRPPCRFIAVNWGPWGEAGMAQVGTKAYEQAVKEGDTPLKTRTALRCLAAALRSAQQAQPAAMQFCACDVEWQKSTWSDLPVLGLVHEPDQAEIQVSASASADVPGTSVAAEHLQKFMVEHTKGRSWKHIQPKSLHQLGLDSLEVVQIRNAFNKAFGVSVPLSTFADVSRSVGDIVEQLAKDVGATDTRAPGSAGDGGGAFPSKLQNFMVEHTRGGSWKRIEGKSFHQLGLDSLEVVQLRNAYNKTFGKNVPLATFADVSQKVGEIVAHLSS